MEPLNIKEFQKLVKRYKEITLEEIEDCEIIKGTYFGLTVAKILTGFGQRTSCILCRATRGKSDLTLCGFCVYYNDNFDDPCCSGENQKSYEGIATATNPRQLFNAFRNRAKHLRKTYPQYLQNA